MKRISLILTLCAAVPLVSTACSKDDSSGGGDGDGDGDGTGGVVLGDGDGDGSGGMAGDGDGDGDTGGMPGDGDGDTGGTAMGGDGMGGDPSMGGMGGMTGTVDVDAMTAAVCAVRAAEGCLFEMTAEACINAYEMAYNDACADEWVARLTCETGLDEDTDWECSPGGGFTATYSAAGDAVCGDAFDAYQTCDN